MGNNCLKVALALAFGIVSISAQAATLNTGDVLTINPGVQVTSPVANATASWFSTEVTGDSKIQGGEKMALQQGTNGIVIGATTTAGPFHAGAPMVGEQNDVVKSWRLLGSTGTNFTTLGITGDTTAGLNMSGWKMSWNNSPNIDMGGGAWTPTNAIPGVPNSGYTNGMAQFSWSGVYGTAYTLNYAATVPTTSPSLPGIKFFWHLEGTVNAAPVPVPAAAWLLGSGLVGLMGVARRHKAQA